MSLQPSASVDVSLFHHSYFVPSCLSLGEEIGQGVRRLLSKLFLVSRDLTSIGSPWSCHLRSNKHWKEAKLNGFQATKAQRHSSATDMTLRLREGFKQKKSIKK